MGRDSEGALIPAGVRLLNALATSARHCVSEATWGNDADVPDAWDRKPQAVDASLRLILRCARGELSQQQAREQKGVHQRSGELRLQVRAAMPVTTAAAPER